MSRLVFRSGNHAYNDVVDIIQTVLISELLCPSDVLWLSSPWISDIPVLDNRCDEFSAVEPDWPAQEITLTSVLTAIAHRGCTVRVTLREDRFGKRFVSQLREAGERSGSADLMEARFLDTTHGKGLLTSHCYLSGSMNFTHNGVQVNDEDLRFDTDPTILAGAALEFMERWDALAQEGGF